MWKQFPFLIFILLIVGTYQSCIQLEEEGVVMKQGNPPQKLSSNGKYADKLERQYRKLETQFSVLKQYVDNALIQFMNQMKESIGNQIKQEVLKNLKGNVVGQMKNEISKDLETKLTNQFKSQTCKDLTTKVCPQFMKNTASLIKAEIQKDISQKVAQEIKAQGADKDVVKVQKNPQTKQIAQVKPQTKQVLKVVPTGSVIDQNTWYRLTTQWQGQGKSLDIINDGTNNRLQLANTGDFSGQFWSFTSVGNNKYRLQTMFTGSKSLDVINDGKNTELQMANTGNFTGQFWTVIKVGQWYRFVCDFQPERSIDIRNDGRNTHPQLAATGHFSGQYWKLQAIRKK